jgi:hypothetical protein
MLLRRHRESKKVTQPVDKQMEKTSPSVETKVETEENKDTRRKKK